MRPAHGGTGGVSGAHQHSDIIDISTSAPVTRALEFSRPLGAAPLEPVPLNAFLEHESRVRAQILQLVIDAASVPAPERPAGLFDHIERLWTAVAALRWTDAPSSRPPFSDPPELAANRRRTVQNFVLACERQNGRPS